MPQLRIPAVYMRGGTSKGVFLAPSRRDGCDVDYPSGLFAVSQGWVAAPRDGIATVRIWQAKVDSSPSLLERCESIRAHAASGHPSGTIAVGAEVARDGGEWKVARAVTSRSARRLMEGWILVPAI